MTKYDEVLSREYDIALWRAKGATWPRIAEELTAQGILVTDGHLRQYWRRRHGSKDAAAVLSELRMAELQASLADAKREIERLAQDNHNAVAERDDAVMQLRAEGAAARQLNVEKCVALAELESCKRQLTDLTARLNSTQRDLQAWLAWGAEAAREFRAQDWANLNARMGALVNRFLKPEGA